MRGKLVARIPDSIIEGIHKATHVVLLTHVHPDGDALGSSFGLADILKGMGKEVCVFLEEPVSHLYAFLPGCDGIRTSLDELLEFVRTGGDDVITIALDSGDDGRLGRFKEQLLELTPLIVIDHHKSHKDFGEYRWVEAGLSSTGEMIYELALELGASVSYVAAVNLYVAICTDTGSFRYDSTSSRTLQIAAELVDIGVRPAEVGDELYDNYSRERLKLLELVLGTLQLFESGQLAFIHVSSKMLTESGASLRDVEGFVDYPRALRSVKVAAFLKEGENGQIAVSLRAKGRCDVAEVAKGFNGGGHRNAAGFRFQDKNLADVQADVLQAIQQKFHG